MVTPPPSGPEGAIGAGLAGTVKRTAWHARTGPAIMPAIPPDASTAMALLDPLKDFLGLGDLSPETLMARYGDDARLVDVDGVRVRVKESGAGEPLVLLHGFSASADTWDGWRRELAEEFRVIAVDVPPFAITGPLPGGPTTPQACLDFLHRLFTALGLERFCLAGNSLGGFLSWNYALRHPERVRKLILLDSVGYEHRAPLSIRMFLTPGLDRIAAALTPRPLVAQNVRSVFGDAARLDRDAIPRYQALLRRRGVRRAVADIMRPIYRDHAEIAQLRVPTLVMWGGRDTWVPPGHGVRFQHDIPGARLIRYDDLGHIPMEEDPVRTARDARAFLRE